MIAWCVKPIYGWIGRDNSYLTENPWIRTSLARSAEQCIKAYFYDGTTQQCYRENRVPCPIELTRVSS